MKPIILIGGGGHCKACIEVIEHQKQLVIEGIVEAHGSKSVNVLGYPVVGNDDDLPGLARTSSCFLITIGHIRSATKRRDLYYRVKGLGATFPTIISPSACVSPHASVGDGTIVMHNAVVNAGVTVGENCIVNTGAIVEHDSMVAAHCHVSTGAIVNGGCDIEEECFIGSGSVVLQGLRIAKGTVIGAGALVVAPIVESGVYVGQPAKRIRTNE
jgi:sugar O-acyltransferase (sialic acid O-acetyltransferase NeuD family)